MSDIKNLVINNESYNIVDDEAVHFSSSQNLTDAEKEMARANINAAKPITYSTEEVLTGDTWIDGKPIYRYIVSGPFTRTGTETTIGTVPEGIETAISVNSTITLSDGTFRSLAFVAAGSSLANWAGAIYVNAAREIRVETGSQYSSATSVTVIFEYTKESSGIGEITDPFG